MSIAEWIRLAISLTAMVVAIPTAISARRARRRTEERLKQLRARD